MKFEELFAYEIKCKICSTILWEDSGNADSGQTEPTEEDLQEHAETHGMELD